MKHAHFLIAYDISSNRHRQRLAKKLLGMGFDRIQFSVFWGRSYRLRVKELEDWCRHQLPLSQNDNLLIIPLPKRQMQAAYAQGKSPEELSDWLNNEGVIFL